MFQKDHLALMKHCSYFITKKSHNPLGLEKLYTNKTKRVKMLEAEQQAAQASQTDNYTKSDPSGTQIEMFTKNTSTVSTEL